MRGRHQLTFYSADDDILHLITRNQKRSFTVSEVAADWRVTRSLVSDNVSDDDE